MIHEMRRGPLSELGVIPQARYYGSQTTTAMFMIALTELWHWTGDIDVLRAHRDTALRTFEWAERYGDLDGDGAQTRVHGRLFLEVAGPMGWFTSEKDLGARRELKLRSDLDDLARYLAKASKG